MNDASVRLGRRRWSRAAFASALLAVLPALPRAQAQRPGVDGTVHAIDTAAHTISLRLGDAIRVGQYDAQTRITVDGMPADVRDLRPGQRCVVTFALSERGATRSLLVALDVRLRRR